MRKMRKLKHSFMTALFWISFFFSTALITFCRTVYFPACPRLPRLPSSPQLESTCQKSVHYFVHCYLAELRTLLGIQSVFRKHWINVWTYALVANEVTRGNNSVTPAVCIPRAEKHYCVPPFSQQGNYFLISTGIMFVFMLSFKGNNI